jgi:hypothetical protein
MIRDGQVTTVAGSGVPGYADGAALQAHSTTQQHWQYHPTEVLFT